MTIQIQTKTTIVEGCVQVWALPEPTNTDRATMAHAAL